jgi:hypothetical protein
MYVDAQKGIERYREAKDLLILVIVMLDKRNYRGSSAGWSGRVAREFQKTAWFIARAISRL